MLLPATPRVASRMLTDSGIPGSGTMPPRSSE